MVQVPLNFVCLTALRLLPSILFYLDEYRYTLTTNPFFGQYASSKGIVNKEHDRAWSYNYQQRLNWHQTYGKNDGRNARSRVLSQPWL